MSDVSDSVRLVLHRSLSSLFTSIAPERLAELCRHVDLRDLRVGEILMSEWDSATEVFILLKGCCGIYSQGTELRLRLVETVEQVGEIIGAQAFLEGRQFRSASIVALDEVQVAVLPGASFRELLSSDDLAAGQPGQRRQVSPMPTHAGFQPGQQMRVVQEVRRAYPVVAHQPQKRGPVAQPIAAAQRVGLGLAEPE
ncbi:MAG: cyclic nucleotide-binding domain-containing protein, partial [Planctomyces sp.]